MDWIRLGLAIRALRRRRGWTQAELGARTALSPSAISRLERGGGDRLSGRALARVSDTLGARLIVRMLWQGEELDRLLDDTHARLVEWTLNHLARAGWSAVPEVTFQVGGERGSIDVFATRPGTATLLVVEVKSVVPDVQAMLSGIDRKARLAPSVARGRGWPAGPVSRLLVLPDDRTARRRVARLDATFSRALPARTVEVRQWVRTPVGVIAGILFVSNVTHTGARHRIGRVRGRVGRPDGTSHARASTGPAGIRAAPAPRTRPGPLGR